MSFLDRFKKEKKKVAPEPKKKPDPMFFDINKVAEKYREVIIKTVGR